jgi:type II secretory pathway pseudopilin PulG
VSQANRERMSSKTTGPSHGEAGFTLIDMLFVVALMGLLATLAIPGMMRARGAANATSALGTLRVIGNAQLSFAITCGLGFYSPDLPTLGVNPPGSLDAFLTSDLTAAATVYKANYAISMLGTSLPGAPASCNGLGAGLAAPGYVAVADPRDVAYNSRYFGTNSDGILYEHDASLSGILPETGAPAVGAPIK